MNPVSGAIQFFTKLIYEARRFAWLEFVEVRRAMQTTSAGAVKKIMILTLFGLMLSTAAWDVWAVQIRGAQSCKTWNDDKANPAAKAENEAWLLGYLSGLASSKNKDFLRDTDSSSFFLWIDNYCQTNPAKDIDDAADQLAKELTKQKRL